MEICEDSELQRKCYKCTKPLYGCLNIIQKDSELTFLLWNKYQIFLYEDFNFESVSKVFIPEFQIYQLIVSNNYLIYVDGNGNVHTTSLKFKNAGQKRFKSGFQPREQGVLHCIKYSPDTTLSLKLHSETLYLSLHKINNEFQLEKEVSLKIDDKDWSLLTSDRGKCILTSHTISKEDFSYLGTLFEESVWRCQSLVLISLDNLSVYACLFSQKSPDEVISLKKLYTSPAKICDIKFTKNECLEILIGLTCGTLVRVQLKDTLDQPEIIHLNTALSKFITLNAKDSIIYTDGTSLWQADSILTKETINFQQFFVKDVKDFIIYNHQLICTTFTNLVYTFPIENKNSFLKSDQDAYCKAENLIKNSDYLYRIKEEIERNKEITDRINREGNHLTALALSKRQDVMNNIIQENVDVYENYEEVIKNNSDVTLTEELQEYFKPGSLLVLIKITATMIQHSLSSMLSDILRNINIHITISAKEEIIKTTSIKLAETLKTLQILIPLNSNTIKHLNIEINVISEIPGALNNKETTWTVLYRKITTLHAEHFIKSNSLNKVNCLKVPKSNIEELILKSAENHHGDLFKFTDISQVKSHENSLQFYVKLPQNFEEIFKDENVFRNHFHAQKAAYIQKTLTSNDFLRSKSNTFFEMCNERVHLEIINDDFSSPLLKVACADIEIASDIRNFFAKLVYNGYKDPCEEYISNALYTTVENLQKSLRGCSSSEECLMLAERLQKNVIATLPL